jgi:hypothetical protein
LGGERSASNRVACSYDARVRAPFAPFAILATTILAIEALLVRLDVLPALRLAIPIVALVLLGIAFWKWARS